MKFLLAIVLLFLSTSSIGQKQKIARTIISRDISDSGKELFIMQWDTLRMYWRKRSEGTFSTDSKEFEDFCDRASIVYRKEGESYSRGWKYTFGTTGGVGCGYHEGDSPYKISVSRNSKEIAIPAIYDFEDSTAWISNPDFSKDVIKLYFGRGFPPLTTLQFFAGNQSGTSSWKKYSRPKRISVYLNGKYWSDLNFDDCVCEHFFKFAPIKSPRKPIIMSFVIKEVYKGQDKRVAISEINFDGIIH